ncbi:hypothetical protein CDL12_29267 [Handroanthus impetiginosus]|uniref:Auxin-repressed protein n=1 Tax=Handroanthus impetiginosus TaxID=429701 RepID=A0A2G9FYW5_9LAMI|nr:hypothetical protein CDL12_29267 [Handroanthus impetiginosus]
MQLWDYIIAGAVSEHGLQELKKTSVKTLNVKDLGENSSKYKNSLSMPVSPVTPGTANALSPTARKDNVWRSVFHPGSNLAIKSNGDDYFDRPQPSPPTVYDWLYSGETRSKHI